MIALRCVTRKQDKNQPLKTIRYDTKIDEKSGISYA